MSSKSQGRTSAVMHRFARQIGPYYGLLACILLLDLLSIPLALLLPLPLKLAVDHLTGQKSASALATRFLPDTWMQWQETPLAFAAALLVSAYLVQHLVG
ncbi:MAG TPA: hypothetical protein VFM10_13010, partial [Terriglobales bacterium]|nr:hypothetical protein [Terriglobales bacterium]